MSPSFFPGVCSASTPGKSLFFRSPICELRSRDRTHLVSKEVTCCLIVHSTHEFSAVLATCSSYVYRG